MAITNINQGTLKASLIPVPSVEEQLEVSNIIANIDDKISIHKKNLARKRELFDSLLHKLMTAELRVDQVDLSELEALGVEVS